MTEPAALIALTALDILALVTLIGALACRTWLVPVANGALQAIQARKLARLTLYCLALLSVTSTALLIAHAQNMSGAAYSAIGPVLPVVLSATHYGHVWVVRIAALAMLWLLAGLPRQASAWPARRLLMFAAALVLAFSRSAAGHAADAGDFSAHEMLDWLHLLAISLWAGGVIAAAGAVFPAALENRARTPLSLVRQGGRISQLAAGALGFVLVTGIYNAWVTLGRWDALWGSVYGHRLLIKLGLVAAMLGCGSANRYLHLPDLTDSTSARRFTIFLYAEALLAVAAIVAAAIMINTAPPGN